MTTIIETLAPILMEIKYDPVENTYNLWGVIVVDNNYTSKYRVSFAIPPNLALAWTIARDDTKENIQYTVSENATKQNDRAFYEANNKVYVASIKATVDKEL